ncbi:MAG: hypothetical protein KIH63_004140 [Candidatus Saccharibacteria bacterium]|nr:hypothetical protein [Candidatus Saccharibacteria bacterium]
MTHQLTRIYDLAYRIDQDLDEVHIEQSRGNAEQTHVIKLNRLHIKLLAEQMNLIEANHTARMGQVVRTELDELMEAISEHWGDLSSDKHVDVCHLSSAKTLYEKAQTVCRIAGCDDSDANIDDWAAGEEGGAVDATGSQLSLLGARS